MSHVHVHLVPDLDIEVYKIHIINNNIYKNRIYCTSTPAVCNSRAFLYPLSYDQQTADENQRDQRNPSVVCCPISNGAILLMSIFAEVAIFHVQD